MKTLSEQGFTATLFGEVRSLPTDRNVNTGVETMKANDIQAVVAIGGGSAMDCARAANAVYSYGGSLDDHNVIHHKYNYSKQVLKPYLAIPTTSGTGSEVAAACGIIKTDPVTGEGLDFFSLISPQLIPDVSIIDPLMSIGLSPSITAATGLDALTHAYEAMVSPVELPLADGLSLEAIYLVFNNLRTAVIHGDNVEARLNMAVCATTATMAFQQCGLGLVHGISEGLSAFALVPHGVANGVLLPPVMAFNSPCVLPKMVRIAAAMGVNTFNLTPQQAAAQAEAEVKALMRDIDMPTTLAEYLTQREQARPDLFKPLPRAVVDQSAKFAVGSHFVHTNPRSVTSADIYRILEEQFAGYKFAD